MPYLAADQALTGRLLIGSIPRAPVSCQVRTRLFAKAPRDMEDIVKRLLFFALATLLLVPSAFGYDSGERFSFLGPGKWAQGRENWGIPVPPAAYPRGYAYNPGYSYGYSPDAYGYGGDVDYCMRRFRSYDPRSGTYLGFDGLRHPCR